MFAYTTRTAQNHYHRHRRLGLRDPTILRLINLRILILSLLFLCPKVLRTKRLKASKIKKLRMATGLVCCLILKAYLFNCAYTPRHWQWSIGTSDYF